MTVFCGGGTVVYLSSSVITFFVGEPYGGSSMSGFLATGGGSL